MRCDWCKAEFTPAKTWQHFCCPQHRDAWHDNEKTLARINAEHDRVRAAERVREDRLTGRLTLDLVAVPEPPLQIKHRKILTVKAGR